MAFVPHLPPSPGPSQDPYSRYRLSLSLPASLNAHLSPPLLPPRPATSSFHRDLPPPLFDPRVMPPPPLPLHARKRKHHQGRSPSPIRESSASPTSEPDSEYDPRGRSKMGAAGGVGNGARQKALSGSSKGTNAKVGPNGRPMSREQLRKANHSLIERRRREKINAALADLRSMVPGLGEENGGKGGEFKLEVLERTVEHMRELKRLVADLEGRLDHGSATGGSSAQSMSPVKRRRHESTSDESMDIDEREDVKPHVRARPSPPKYFTHHGHVGHGIKTSPTPPSPSVTPPSRNTTLVTPDPNETEDETNLPPPLTLAHRERERASDEGSSSHNSSHTTASPHPPSISSLLSSTTQPPRSMPHSSSTTRPSPSPNIYLPFPTPSPTSPFLTYHPSSASTASSATGPPEPSPFLAPLQNISLFGGAIETSPLTGPQKPSPPEQRRALEKDAVAARDKERDMGAEEAASLLLAISSPDTMRPMGSTGSTPLMSAVAHRGLERRLTLEAEEFTLDGGVRSADGTHHGGHGHAHQHKSRSHHAVSVGAPPAQGKTARDILRM